MSRMVVSWNFWPKKKNLPRGESPEPKVVAVGPDKLFAWLFRVWAFAELKYEHEMYLKWLMNIISYLAR